MVKQLHAVDINDKMAMVGKGVQEGSGFMTWRNELFLFWH
jgi:hypothetical protein